MKTFNASWKKRAHRPTVVAFVLWFVTLFAPALVRTAAGQNTAYKFDFGASTYTEAGYVAVDNTLTYTAARGYGWLATTGLLLRDRGVPDDALRRDFVFTNTSAALTFRVSGLSPGKYLMKVLCGDASYGDHVITVSVPGAGTLPTILPRTGEFLMLLATVNTTGTLDITFGSPTPNWVVNALTLEPTTTDITPVIESSNVSEWDATVFATDPTQSLLDVFNGIAASSVNATGLTRADYLRLITSEVDFWKTKQNSSGAIIDPYRNVETQYATPAFANAAAALVVYGNRADLVEPAAKAMDWATLRLHNRAAADSHEDFYPPMLAHALMLLKPYVTASRAATWESNLNYDPYAIYRQAMGSMNWNIVSSCGEALLEKLGIRPTSNFYVQESWAAQGRHFTSPYGLYTEGPMAYDHFPRIWLEDVIAQGYTGLYSTEVKQAMDRAAIASLFMQSPWGELPAGGRSAHHQWNEAEQAVTYEIYAAKAKTAGDTRMAGAYKRAAHLALSSMFRWVRPTGEMQIVKNWVNPSSRHGYEGYSYHSQYNLLPMAMLATAYEYAASTEDVFERPAPADTGGFIFQITDLNKVFANAGGTYVELDTTADHHYDATGLIRVHVKGVPPQLGPSDSLLSGASYTSPNPSSISTGVGVSWQDSSSVWHTLGEMGSTEITSVTVTPLSQSPSRVAFDVTYAGSMAGVTSLTEHYVIAPDGVQLTTELPGYNGALRYVWPVLYNDGKTLSTISVSGSTVSVSQGGSAAQTFTAPGAQSVRVETNNYSNHNGWARLGIAEFPSGGKITLLIGAEKPPVSTAGTLHVDLRASASSGAGTATWVNNGTLGNFVRTGTAPLVTNVANTGLPGVLFNGTSDAYTSIGNTVADLEGNSNRSIEVWAYNPAIGQEESLVSWGRRTSTRTNVSLNFSSSTGWGAATHFNDDLGWGTVPSAGAWHHLAYVYSGSTDARVYVDGALANSKTLGGVLATTGTNPINIGAQRSSNGTLTSGVYFSGYINSVRVHGGALTAAQVAVNYGLGPPAAPTLNAIADQTIPYGTASVSIPLTLGDSDTPTILLSLSGSAVNSSLIPLANLVFSGSGASRTAVITPVAGVSGSTSVTFVVSDRTSTASQSFNLTVLTQLQTWCQQNFGASWNDPAIAGDMIDRDKDGLSNLLEYALGSDPTLASSGATPQLVPVNNKLTISFTRNTAATDVTLSVLGADDLTGTWTELARSTGGAAFTVITNGAAVSESGSGATRTVQVDDIYSTTDAAHNKRFLKLQVQH